MKSHLCKCLLCNVVLIDKNPQIGAALHETDGSELEMELIKEGGEYFWGCPVCHDDGNLIDL